MAKYENKSGKPHLGLLNFEGDTFRAYKIDTSDYVIVDDTHEIIEFTNTKGIIYIMNGGKPLTTSYGRTYTIPNEHENARPTTEKLQSFLGLSSLEQEEDDLELWESVQYRMDGEGFDYCFESYSDWDEIKDEEFHRLRLGFLQSMEDLRNYIDKKVDEGRQKEWGGE
jgi:hypothetical protein